jgi:hypothetical protein
VKPVGEDNVSASRGHRADLANCFVATVSILPAPLHSEIVRLAAIRGRYPAVNVELLSADCSTSDFAPQN